MIRRTTRPAERKRRFRPATAGNRKLQRRLVRLCGQAQQQRFLLRLYVTGATPASVRAIERVRQVCDDHLQGRYALEVIDVHQLPALAKNEQIVATPTLVRVLPRPLRRFIGDLSTVERVLFGLDLLPRSR